MVELVELIQHTYSQHRHLQTTKSTTGPLTLLLCPLESIHNNSCTPNSILGQLFAALNTAPQSSSKAPAAAKSSVALSVASPPEPAVAAHNFIVTSSPAVLLQLHPIQKFPHPLQRSSFDHKHSCSPSPCICSLDLIIARTSHRHIPQINTFI